MRKHNIAEFELSQAYLFFWDKLEKANYFLEQILDTVAEPLDGRLVQTLLASPVGDGGQWDMVANLVAKYGLVPQSQYPDSWSASNSTPMDTLVTTKLREDALELRQLVSSKSSQSSVHDAKEKMMRDIHGILTVMLGPPPAPNKEFTWEFTDKDEKFHSLSTTPVKFAQELSTKEGIESNSGSDVKELFSLVNDPRNEYMELLTVSRLGNVIGMRGITYVNVDMAVSLKLSPKTFFLSLQPFYSSNQPLSIMMWLIVSRKTMKKACIAQLRANLPIFFGSDVGKYSDSASGIMDTSMLDYELGFNVKLGMTKAQRLLTHESAMTHAMVLTAVHVEKGKGGDEGSEGGDEERAVRWRVQNSWGDGVGTKGWFVMSDAWMDQFVYQAVVDPRFVSRDVTDVLKKDPIVLPLWDPMGALA